MILKFGLNHTPSNQVLSQMLGEVCSFHLAQKSSNKVLTLSLSERFLKEGGGSRGGSTRDLIPFGGGARLCLGESVAKMELFLFSAYLLRDFQFLLPESETSLPDLRGVASVVLKIKSYKVVARPRPVTNP